MGEVRWGKGKDQTWVWGKDKDQTWVWGKGKDQTWVWGKDQWGQDKGKGWEEVPMAMVQRQDQDQGNNQWIVVWDHLDKDKGQDKGQHQGQGQHKDKGQGQHQHKDKGLQARKQWYSFFWVAALRILYVSVFRS